VLLPFCSPSRGSNQVFFLFRKGSILSGSEVRNIIINYVKTNELVDETNKK